MHEFAQRRLAQGLKEAGRAPQALPHVVAYRLGEETVYLALSVRGHHASAVVMTYRN